MNIKRVKQGARITYYNGGYMILFGIFLIFFINFNMNLNFQQTSEWWSFFSRYDSEIANIFYFMNYLIGILLTSLGIFIMYLSDFIYKRKEKMTWVILFLSGIICWAGLVIISIFLKNYILITLTSIGWLFFIIGMVLPIRYYLEKNYREY